LSRTLSCTFPGRRGHVWTSIPRIAGRPSQGIKRVLQKVDQKSAPTGMRARHNAKGRITVRPLSRKHLPSAEGVPIEATARHQWRSHRPSKKSGRGRSVRVRAKGAKRFSLVCNLLRKGGRFGQDWSAPESDLPCFKSSTLRWWRNRPPICSERLDSFHGRHRPQSGQGSRADWPARAHRVDVEPSFLPFSRSGHLCGPSARIAAVWS